jgi:hypothetical protein
VEPSPTPDANAPTPPPHGAGYPLASSSSEPIPSGMGGSSIPPINYNDLGRPPPLPIRPSMTPRKSSNTGSIRDNELTKTASNSTLTPETAGDKKSRTPSPEKKGRMLRTLRPGREGKTASKMPSSLRSRPEASKAATQAWTRPGLGLSNPSTSSLNAATSSRPSLGMPTPSTTSLSAASARSSMEKTGKQKTDSSSAESPQPQQSQAPFYFRAGEGSSATAYAVPAATNATNGTNSAPGAVPTLQRMAPPPIPRKSIGGQMPGAQSNPAPLPPISMPSYRKEYNAPTPMDARAVAKAAAVRSRMDMDDELYGGQQASRPTRRAAPPPANTYNNTRSRGARGQSNPEPIALGEDESDEERRPRPPPPRNGRKRGDSIRADCLRRPSQNLLVPIKRTPKSQTNGSDGRRRSCRIYHEVSTKKQPSKS